MSDALSGLPQINPNDQNQIQNQPQPQPQPAPGKNPQINTHPVKPLCGKNGSCTFSDLAKIAGVMFLFLLVIAGTAGLLVYLNKLSVGLQGIGSMTTSTGFYTMLGGYGLLAISVLLIGVQSCIATSRANALVRQQQLPKP